MKKIYWIKKIFEILPMLIIQKYSMKNFILHIRLHNCYDSKYLNLLEIWIQLETFNLESNKKNVSTQIKIFLRPVISSLYWGPNSIRNLFFWKIFHQMNLLEIYIWSIETIEINYSFMLKKDTLPSLIRTIYCLGPIFSHFKNSLVCTKFQFQNTFIDFFC